MSSRGALSKRPSAMREWLLFGAAALLPAVGLGALGLRALRNEEAAIRREASLNVASVAQRLVGSANQQVAEAEGALQRASFDDSGERPATPSAWYDAAKAIAPRCGAPIVVSPSGGVAMPAEQPTARDERPDPSCSSLARDLSNAKGEAKEPMKRELIGKCQEARDGLGRWLWPTIVLDALREKDDLDLQQRLVSWVDQHASRMRPTERQATRLDIAEVTQLTPAVRSELSSRLENAAARAESFSSVVQSDVAARAIRMARGETVSWRGEASVGVLRPLSSGWLVGFVVTPTTWADTISESIDQGSRDDLRITVVSHLDEDRTSDLKKTTAQRSLESSSARESRGPEAVEWLTDGLGARVVLAHPEALLARTSRSVALLGAIAVSGALVAMALALTIFSRMRAARRTSELRTSFVAAVSHELRTPIASIRMLAELLEENRVEPDERAEVHDALAREARRLGETVDRLLGFSRMAAGKLSVELRRTRIADPVAAAVCRFRERNPEVRVEEDLDRDVVGDVEPAQIELIIDNLLANAKKYAPDGQPYRVRVKSQDGDARVSVGDHGPGIEKRDQRRIFEAFERVDDRLSKATEGSGIGLSLVAHAARAHHGRAWVESEPGQGACFMVSFPAAKRGADAVDSALPPDRNSEAHASVDQDLKDP